MYTTLLANVFERIDGDAVQAALVWWRGYNATLVSDENARPRRLRNPPGVIQHYRVVVAEATHFDPRKASTNVVGARLHTRRECDVSGPSPNAHAQSHRFGIVLLLREGGHDEIGCCPLTP